MSTAARQTRVHPRALSTAERCHGFEWLLDSVEVVRHRVGRELDPARRSELGQFLTPLAVARFMAAMAHGSGSTVRILDAGAGVGSLAAALVAELGSRPKKPRRVEVIAYELDAGMATALGATLVMCEEACKAAGVEFTGRVLQEDFIRAASEVVEGGLLAPPKRISWESEVWVAESPTHMIHFNGERFLGPYE